MVEGREVVTSDNLLFPKNASPLEKIHLLYEHCDE